MNNSPVSTQGISLGDRLRQLREDHNLSQEKLAEKLHRTRQSISSWERDRSQPDISSLQQLSEIYQLPIDDILHGIDRVAPKPSRWRWLFFVAACVLFLVVVMESMSTAMMYHQISSIGVIGGADGPTAIYATATVPPIPHSFASVILPCLNLAVSMFCVYWMIGLAHTKAYKFYRTIAILLLFLATTYILIQLVGSIVLGASTNDARLWPGIWLSFIGCLMRPGFWATLLIGIYALTQYLKKRKSATLET